MWVIVGVLSLFASACDVAEDCSLNGQCVSGSCVCDPWWVGGDCGELVLSPAERGSGYNRSAETISSWGGRIVADPDGKTWHLFASEFVNHCGLGDWSPNSRVIRAESTRPQGPFTFREEVLTTFHHNPTVVYDAFHKIYLLYTIGVNISKVVECKAAEQGAKAGWPDPGNHESGISLWTSASLYGPWQAMGVVLGSDANGTWDADTTNPSAMVRADSGEVLLMYRGCGDLCSGGEKIGLAVASSYRGPYERLSSKAPLFENKCEDPFIWQDSRGWYHALVHSLEPGGGFGAGPKVGRHAYSRDGAFWTFNTATLAYNTTVHFTDGTTITYLRRERPQLYFDARGTPRLLTTGVQERGRTGSYTLAQPVGPAP